MHWARDLRERFLEITAFESKARWAPFEALLAALFKRGHFRVERESKAAAPRQLDLAASSRGSAYLVEAKWKTRPLTVGDLDGLYARLDGTAPGDNRCADQSFRLRSWRSVRSRPPKEPAGLAPRSY
jgi:hypothetical protein